MKILLALAISTMLLTLPASAQDKAYLSEVNDLAVKDDLAVRQVIARANQALDTADYPLYASFYSEDAVFVSGFGNAEGREAIAAAMEASRPFIINKRHVSGNLVISGAGDTAKVTSYLIVFERETGLDYVGSAINIDTIEKRDGRWLITRHESTLDPATARAAKAAMEQQ